jgi:hypothetical protein
MGGIMDTFAQRFTTSWVSGGVKIKVQVTSSSIGLVWQLDNAVETGTVTSARGNYMEDNTKSWGYGDWVGYYVGWTGGYHPGVTRYIASAYEPTRVYWYTSESLFPYVSGEYGFFTSPSEFFSIEEEVNYTGDRILPNVLKLELFLWDSSYSTTINNDPLVTDYTTVASEEIEDAEQWVYLFWEPLLAGTYLWKITVIDGDDTGALKILYDNDSTKFESWKNSLSLSGDYYSEVMGLETTESYENVMSVYDSFDGGFVANDGVNNVKVNKSSTYYDAIKTGNVATTSSDLKGRVATGSSVKVV